MAPALHARPRSPRNLSCSPSCIRPDHKCPSCHPTPEAGPQQQQRNHTLSPVIVTSCPQSFQRPLQRPKAPRGPGVCISHARKHEAPYDRRHAPCLFRCEYVSEYRPYLPTPALRTRLSPGTQGLFWIYAGRGVHLLGVEAPLPLQACCAASVGSTVVLRTRFLHVCDEMFFTITCIIDYLWRRC